VQLETLESKAYLLLHAGPESKKQNKKVRDLHTTMPMEQVYGHCDKDTLKMAMLKHEETFRQQVS
jgi:hypothetical protein